jgi:N-acetylmuramoyl-L-alanine amidase
MSVRATSLAFLFGAMVLGGASAAERPGTPTAPVPALPGPNDVPVASEVRLGGDDTQTRMVFDLSQKIDVRAFTLANPYRVVMDMPQVTFRLPPKTGEAGRGLIKAFRFGLVMQGGSRIVMDVNKPVRIDKAFVIEPAAGQPARLVVDLAATDRDSFMKTLAAEGRPVQAVTASGVERENAHKGDPRPIIVLDPGHGGIDNGAVAGSGAMEKDIVLEFSTTLRDQLERSGKYRVVMTRTDDTFIPLVDRVRMARIRQAALFVSIHADAIGKGEGEAQGATIYTLSETASDAEAGRLAETENRADVIAGIDMSHEPGDVADILIDLAQRETKAFSLHFAKTLVADMKKVARMHKNPLKSGGFKVLKAPDVPAVLIELGYVSSKDDLKQLTSEAWRTKTAGAISSAIDNFFSTRIAGATAGRGTR